LGADLAAKKGLIVCNSAGNSGDEAWRYIIAPADGDSVLAIGAIAIDSIPGSFSSYGPTADGRVKPDVASVGVNTRVIATNGTVVEGSGTSFANPNLAGLIACLWQAFPEFSNMEIIDAVKRSAHKFLSPDTRVGYGIPNMRKAYQDLLAKKQEKLLKEEWVKAFPNPFTSNVNVIINAKETGDLLTQLSDMNGRVISRTKQSVQQNITYTIAIAQAGALPRGVYNLVVINGKNKKTIRLVK
jgi:subtilisin family serine protease